MTADEIAEKIWDDNTDLLTEAYGDLDQAHDPKIFGYEVDYQITFRGMVNFALLQPAGLSLLLKLDAVVNDTKGRLLVLPGMQLPTASRFTTIVADPPWKYGNQAAKGAVGDKYEKLSLDEIAGMPIEGLAEDNAHLYLWITSPLLLEGHHLAVAEAWGFKPKSLITWLKKGRMGVGNYFRGDTEHIVFCVRGKLPTNKPHNVRNWFVSDHENEFFEAPWVKHSRKPEISYDVIAQKSPGPYLELFARSEPMKASKDWTRWGNQAIGKTEISALDAYFKSLKAAA
jgi:N6-adenosine-specific RNA methylase IME4